MRSRQRTIGPEPDTHRTTKNGNKRNYRHCSAVCPPLWLRLHKSRHGHGVIIIIPICGRRCRRSGSSTELCEKWTPLLCADGVFFCVSLSARVFACFALRALHHDIIMMCACQAYPGDMGAICWAESAQWWATTTLVPVWPGQKSALSLALIAQFERRVQIAATCFAHAHLALAAWRAGGFLDPSLLAAVARGDTYTHTHTQCASNQLNGARCCADAARRMPWWHAHESMSIFPLSAQFVAAWLKQRWCAHISGSRGARNTGAVCRLCRRWGGGGLIKYAALACNAYNAIWVHSAETHTHAKSEEKEREREI